MNVVRDYFEAYVCMYIVIKAVDIVDVDGDGVVALVGLLFNVGWFESA